MGGGRVGGGGGQVERGGVGRGRCERREVKFFVKIKKNGGGGCRVGGVGLGGQGG